VSYLATVVYPYRIRKNNDNQHSSLAYFMPSQLYFQHNLLLGPQELPDIEVEAQQGSTVEEGYTDLSTMHVQVYYQGKNSTKQ
jgi:hypothetical protein